MIFIKLVITKILLFFYFGINVNFEISKISSFNLVSAFFKINKSVENPIFNANGKITYYKVNHNYVSLLITKKGFIIDYWVGDSLLTFQSVQCNDNSFMNQLGVAITFFAAIFNMVSIEAKSE